MSLTSSGGTALPGGACTAVPALLIPDPGRPVMQPESTMQENTTLYRIGLSGAGGTITALLGLLVGAAWAVALNVDVLMFAVLIGALGFVWGAISFQLTPTGGVIMENRTTVNYAVSRDLRLDRGLRLHRSTRGVRCSNASVELDLRVGLQARNREMAVKPEDVAYAFLSAQRDTAAIDKRKFLVVELVVDLPCRQVQIWVNPNHRQSRRR